MQERRLAQGLTVSAVGLGCMWMSNPSRPTDKGEMIALIRAAVERGVTFFDSAQAYGPFANRGTPRGGARTGPRRGRDRDEVRLPLDEGIPGGVDSRPKTITESVERSLRRLRTETIDLLYQHRVDPNVPMEEVAGTVKELIEEER